MNYFYLSSRSLIERILAASPDKNSITLTMKCTSTGFDDAAGRCHQDVPHITIHNTDGKLTVNTYPKINDKKLITIDKCGNLISGGGGTAQKSKDAVGGNATNTGQANTGATPTGKKLNFAAPQTGTLTSDQAIVNKISSGEIKKNADILGLIRTAYGYRKIYVMVYEVPFLQETHNKLHYKNH